MKISYIPVRRMIFPKTSISAQVRTSCQVSLNPTHKLSTRETGLIHTSMLAIFVSDPFIYPINEIFISHPSICDPPSTYPPIHLYTHSSIHPPFTHPFLLRRLNVTGWREPCVKVHREKSQVSLRKNPNLNFLLEISFLSGKFVITSAKMQNTQIRGKNRKL